MKSHDFKPPLDPGGIQGRFTTKGHSQMILSTTRKSEAGFTLVELAIVLMIIGLLIGGILRGQELMENARVTSTIQQTKAYDGATTTFRDAYSALPGDIVQPGNRLPNCTTAPCNTQGDGNSIIGTPMTARGGAYDTGTGTENRRYWLHMAVARLISGVDASGASTGGWGIMFPAAKIAGGFHVVFANIAAAAPAPAIAGHFLILRNNSSATGTVASEGNGNSALSPLRAAQIDRKLDDGLPQTGDVVGVGAGADCTAATGYLENSEERNCNLMIRVQN
jgi:prepilin-type N-terminal cleavage/methylation domain-containing protein